MPQTNEVTWPKAERNNAREGKWQEGGKHTADVSTVVYLSPPVPPTVVGMGSLEWTRPGRGSLKAGRPPLEPAVLVEPLHTGAI